MDSFISCVCEEIKSGKNEYSAGKGQQKQKSDGSEEMCLCKKTKRNREILWRVAIGEKDSSNMPSFLNPYSYVLKSKPFISNVWESKHVSGDKKVIA